MGLARQPSTSLMPTVSHMAIPTYRGGWERRASHVPSRREKHSGHGNLFPEICTHFLAKLVPHIEQMGADWKIQTPELLGWELAGESDRLGEEVEKQEQY